MERKKENSDRRRCLNAINFITPNTSPDDNIKGRLDDLDLIDIIMQVEQEFNCTIQDEVIQNEIPVDLDKVSDLIDWLEARLPHNLCKEKQAEIVRQRLDYYFKNRTGDWIIPNDMPFMVEFLNEVDKLCTMLKLNKLQ